MIVRLMAYARGLSGDGADLWKIEERDWDTRAAAGESESDMGAGDGMSHPTQQKRYSVLTLVQDRLQSARASPPRSLRCGAAAPASVQTRGAGSIGVCRACLLDAAT